jgi:hypothetical protein
MLATLIIGLNFAGCTALPEGPAPAPVPVAHFPDRLHAFVWRNWPLVPVARMAETVQATPEQIVALGRAMGLPDPPFITEDLRRRSYITVIRRNWHLLPYGQLQQLLGWTEDELAFTLQEDDFLWVKLGSLKPRCQPIVYAEPSETVRARQREMSATLAKHFPQGMQAPGEPLFAFVEELSQPLEGEQKPAADSDLSPRYCYSYLATYGDPLLDPDLDPYPDGLLARLAGHGVDGVWLQAVLYRLAPFPWDPSISDRYLERLENLRLLVEKARRHGVGVYLYLNEPRSMPLSFFENHPELRGVVDPHGGGHATHAALCTSVPEVRQYLRDSVALLCREVPDLAGIFTITASENLTNCWSRFTGDQCPRCGKRSPAEVIAEVNTTFYEGIRDSGADVDLLVWDWGWRNDWAPEIIARLPKEAALISVSEWDLPIERGGVETTVGEYSISSVGPGPRADRHWKLARERGMRTIAKVQAGTTWEISTVPYVPALANVARHAANLERAGIDGLMLGWTLGGYPSANLEVFYEVVRRHGPSVDEVLHKTAARRFGEELADDVVAYWQAFSDAFSQYPYHTTTVYGGPVQIGPANLLWGKPTGYGATMVCFPYDDLRTWRSVYPPDVFIGQLDKMADGIGAATLGLRKAAADVQSNEAVQTALERELGIAESCAIVFRSAANQSKFVQARDRLASAANKEQAAKEHEEIRCILESELELALRLHAIQCRDSRIGFEASNHYFFVPIDLVEKVLNVEYLLTQWLPKAGI